MKEEGEGQQHHNQTLISRAKTPPGPFGVNERFTFTNSSFLLQVARPVTLKKDGIQTRNRKLQGKTKKAAMTKGGLASMTSTSDFFRGLSASSYGSSAVAGHHVSSPAAVAAAHGYNHLNYYTGNHQNFGQMTHPTQFNPYNLTSFGASAFFGTGSTTAASA